MSVPKRTGRYGGSSTTATATRLARSRGTSTFLRPGCDAGGDKGNGGVDVVTCEARNKYMHISHGNVEP
eukprot:12258958-Alexandrium_andersonii.AAC.1